MEAAAEAHFSDICPLFFAVASSPAPILEALHPGLPIQRALLKAALVASWGTQWRVLARAGGSPRAPYLPPLQIWV